MDDAPPGYSELASHVNLWSKFAQGENFFVNNADAVSRRMWQFNGKIFCESGETPMQIEFMDVKTPAKAITVLGRQCQTVPFYDMDSMKTYLKTGQGTMNLGIGVRVISIHASSPSSPLSITSEAMHYLLSYHKIAPQFLDLLLSFATGLQDTGAGSGSAIHKNNPNGSYDIQYTLRYPEQLIPGTWEISQTALYHRHNPKTMGSFWILLHSRPESVLQTRLRGVVRQWEKMGGLANEWEFLHVCVLSSYVGEWRWFLMGLGGEVEDLVQTAQSLLHTPTSSSPPTTRQDLISSLHALQTRLLPLKPMLESTLATIRALSTIFSTLRSKGSFEEGLGVRMVDELRGFDVQVTGYLAGVEGLEKRAGGVRDLVRGVGK